MNTKGNPRDTYYRIAVIYAVDQKTKEAVDVTQPYTGKNGVNVVAVHAHDLERVDEDRHVNPKSATRKTNIEGYSANQFAEMQKVANIDGKDAKGRPVMVFDAQLQYTDRGYYIVNTKTLKPTDIPFDYEKDAANNALSKAAYEEAKAAKAAGQEVAATGTEAPTVDTPATEVEVTAPTVAEPATDVEAKAEQPKARRGRPKKQPAVVEEFSDDGVDMDHEPLPFN